LVFSNACNWLDWVFNWVFKSFFCWRKLVNSWVNRCCSVSKSLLSFSISVIWVSNLDCSCFNNSLASFLLVSFFLAKVIKACFSCCNNSLRWLARIFKAFNSLDCFVNKKVLFFKTSLVSCNFFCSFLINSLCSLSFCSNWVFTEFISVWSWVNSLLVGRLFNSCSLFFNWVSKKFKKSPIVRLGGLEASKGCLLFLANQSV